MWVEYEVLCASAPPLKKKTKKKKHLLTLLYIIIALRWSSHEHNTRKPQSADLACTVKQPPVVELSRTGTIAENPGLSRRYRDSWSLWLYMGQLCECVSQGHHIYYVESVLCHKPMRIK